MAESVEECAASGAGVVTARGPRAVEALLLAQVAELAGAARRDPQRLALPVRIVVPSRSLADHVGERLVAHAGRSLAGVLVQTLHGLALEVLERSGEAPPASDALFPILVRRLAAEEPALREPLGGLADGYAAVEAAVADLLDAGFDAGSAEAVLDALGAGAADAAVRGRAQAVVRVAQRCLAAMQRSGVGHRAVLLAAAREALLRDPGAALPARAVLIHGFADATGLRAELLEALVRQRQATVMFDEPPDPAAPAAPDAGRRFSERLRGRLVGVAGERAAAPPSGPESAREIACMEAANADAEVREVAARVRGELAAGTPPERIGVVARDLAGYRSALRLHFDRLGIPFTGTSPGGFGPLARRAGALDELLRERAGCRTERWLAAAALAPEPHAASALRLVLRSRGLLRLRELAGFAPEADDLRRVVAAARATHDALDRMAATRACREQLTDAEALLASGLGWRPELAEVAPLLRELAELRSALPPEFPLALDDLALLLRRRFARVVAEPLGGAGGGVQLLDATQARGRSFDALFLMGLVRDVFPRSVREEALLPDFVREGLRAALPDVPLKQLGHDEERFLFAQLVAASPRVTLSWPIASDDGRPCARSSFVERLRWSVAGFEPERAHPLLSPSAQQARAGDAAVRCMREHALVAALHAPRERLPEVLPLALRELPLRAAAAEPGALADARLRVLREFEAGGAPQPRLGPYFGFVGAARAAPDPRARPLHVTRLENLAGCAWQTFVRRLLGIGPPPDATETLPGCDRRLLGSTVHGVLAALVPEGCDPAAGVRLVWPEAEGLEALARAQAARVLADEKVFLPGLARVLALQALPHLARARELDALEGDRLRVTGAERPRSAAISDAQGRARELHFRVDRIERIDGVERLTDYKTGEPLSGAVKDDTRLRHFRKAVARGTTLQPVAYALAAEPGGSGRLLYLDPDSELDAAAASFVARREDAELAGAFQGAVHALLGAWDAGSFAPRLVEPGTEDEASICKRCDVAQACLQGDTGARGRLAAWLADPRPAAGAGLSAAEQALLAVHGLGAAPAQPEAEDA